MRALAVLMSVALVLGGTLTNFWGVNTVYVKAENAEDYNEDTSEVTGAIDFPKEKNPKDGKVYDGNPDVTFKFTGKKGTAAHTISGFGGRIFCAFVDGNGNVLQAPSSNGTYTVKTEDIGKTIRAKLSKGDTVINAEMFGDIMYNDAVVWSGYTAAVKASDSTGSTAGNSGSTGR